VVNNLQIQQAQTTSLLRQPAQKPAKHISAARHHGQLDDSATATRKPVIFRRTRSQRSRRLHQLSAAGAAAPPQKITIRGNAALGALNDQLDSERNQWATLSWLAQHANRNQR